MRLILKLSALVIILQFFFGKVFSQSWSQIITSGSVPQLKNASAIYDPAGNRMIVFGGRTPSGLSNQMWSLNLSSEQWIQIIQNGQIPPPRFTQNAVYDSAGNRMIIWSGHGAELYNDVWAFNLSNNTWVQLWPDGNVNGVPLKRYGTASVFDPVYRRLITFAGFTTNGRFEDTWSFQTDSMRWADRTNNPHPPMRCLHSACFAFDQRKMLIYAGQQTGALDDIWSLDVNNFVWTDLTPSFKPPGRFWNSIIYSGNGNVIVFGGLSGSASYNDMWKFSILNNSWIQVNQGVSVPPERWGHVAVYIPSQDRMIIFGGDGAISYNDTWQFTNVSVIGIKQISGNVPQNFNLYQNYPNPFNPSTVINFQLPVNSFVALKVYDVNGKEVETLVNKYMKPGTYEVDWDASGFASGVYFYRMYADGNIAITKKMILLE